MTGWTLRSCNVGLHLGVSQNEVICITAYGKYFTGVTPYNLVSTIAPSFLIGSSNQVIYNISDKFKFKPEWIKDR